MRRREFLLITIAAIMIGFLAWYYAIYMPSLKQGIAEAKIRNWVFIVVVDNYPNPKFKELRSVWGISILVNVSGTYVLFDTGPSPDSLEHNLKVLGVDLSKVKYLVLSHEHGDHVGGIELFKGRALTVFVPRHMSASLIARLRNLGFKVVEVGDTKEILPGLYIVGELYGPPWEQALALETEKGLIVFVGCAHPGVDRIVEKAVKDLGKRPLLVIGGFHMTTAPASTCEKVVKRLIRLGVRKIAPIHCSGDTIRDILRNKFREYFIEAYVGYYWHDPP